MFEEERPRAGIGRSKTEPFDESLVETAEAPT